MRLILLILLSTMFPGGAEILPVSDVYWLCAKADAVIAGEHFRGDVVHVARWVKGAPDPAPKSIFVRDFEKLSKTLYEPRLRRPRLFGQQPEVTLTTRRFIAFLERRADECWQVMVTVIGRDPGGADGMIWIQDGRCFRYDRFALGDGYELAPAEDFGTENGLLSAMEVGMRDFRKWDETLAISASRQRARALTAYLLPRTSPESPRDTHRFWVREPLRATGEEALPAILEQFAQWREGDSLDGGVLVLYDLAEKARPAVPELVKLLKCPERVSTGTVLEALGAAGDKSVIGEIRPFLEHPDEFVRLSARKALARLTGEEMPLPSVEAAAPAESGEPVEKEESAGAFPSASPPPRPAPAVHSPASGRFLFWLWVTAWSGVLSALVFLVGTFLLSTERRRERIS